MPGRAPFGAVIYLLQAVENKDHRQAEAENQRDDRVFHQRVEHGNLQRVPQRSYKKDGTPAPATCQDQPGGQRSMSELSRSNPTARFSGLADLYARCRPGYPEEALDFLMARCGLGGGS